MNLLKDLEERTMSHFDFLSPFEELVLTAAGEAGHGADKMKVMLTVQRLSQRDTIRLMRVDVALQMLEEEGCLYSWVDDDPELGEDQPRHYRVQLRGQRALEAAARRRGPKPLGAYFHRAGRFGIFWDVVLGYLSRKRAWEGRE